MARIPAIIVFYVLLLCGAYSQPMLLPVQENNGNWGFINLQGEFIVPPVYDYASDFIEGYAIVGQNGKKGIIGPGGTLITSRYYDNVEHTRNKEYKVLLNNKEGYVFDGQLVGNTLFDSVKLASSLMVLLYEGNLVRVHSSRFGLLEGSYDRIMDYYRNYFFLYKNNKVGLANEYSGILFPVEYQRFDLQARFGFFSFLKDSLWGLANVNGEILVQASYSAIDPIDSNYVKIGTGNKYQLYHVPSKTTLFESRYDHFVFINSEFLMVINNGLAALGNSRGQVLSDFRYHTISTCNHPDLFRTRLGRETGLLNKSGREVIPASFELISAFNGELAIVNKFTPNEGRRSGLINSRGDMLFLPEYQRIELSEDALSAKLIKRDMLRLVNFNENGTPVALDEYSNVRTITVATNRSTRQVEITSLAESLGWFYDANTNLWGKRNADGEIIIPPSFDDIYIKPEYRITIVKKTLERLRVNNIRYGIVNDSLNRIVVAPIYTGFDLSIAKSQQVVILSLNFNFELYNFVTNHRSPPYTFISEFKDGWALAYFRGNVREGKETPYSIGRLDVLCRRIKLSDCSNPRRWNQPIHVNATHGKWHIIHASGLRIDSLNYEHFSNYAHQKFIVANNGKWGVVSPNGEKLVPLKYKHINFLHNTNDSILMLREINTKMVLYNSDGKSLTALEYEKIHSFVEGLALVKYYEDGRRKYNFIDYEGKRISEEGFEKSEEFSEGLAAVMVDGRWGYINSNGSFEVEPQFRFAGSFKNGLSPVRTVRRDMHYIRTDGQAAFKQQFTQALNFSSGTAIVRFPKGYGVINKEGEFILKPHYASISRSSTADLFFAKKNRKTQLLNTDGQLLNRNLNNYFHDFNSGQLLTRKGRNYIFINENGKREIKEKFKHANAFYQGTAIVKKGSFNGFINNEGEMVLPYVYHKVNEFENGFAILFDRRAQGVINLKGDTLVPLVYQKVEIYDEGFVAYGQRGECVVMNLNGEVIFKNIFAQVHSLKNGLMAVYIGEKWGVATSEGEIVIKPEYDKIEISEDGFIRAHLNSQVNIADLEGGKLLSNTYKNIVYMQQDVFRVHYGSKFGYILKDGNWIWQP